MVYYLLWVLLWWFLLGRFTLIGGWLGVWFGVKLCLCSSFRDVGDLLVVAVLYWLVGLLCLLLCFDCFGFVFERLVLFGFTLLF